MVAAAFLILQLLLTRIRPPSRYIASPDRFCELTSELEYETAKLDNAQLQLEGWQLCYSLENLHGNQDFADFCTETRKCVAKWKKQSLELSFLLRSLKKSEAIAEVEPHNKAHGKLLVGLAKGHKTIHTIQQKISRSFGEC